MPPLSKPLAPTPLAILPTLATLSSFIQAFFPIRTGDVNFLYHTPRPLVDPATMPVRRVVLSITPTPGVYAALSRPEVSCSLAFLHRPWQLDRRRVPRGVTVLSSHKGFDEVLTVGANFALAERLGMKVDGGEGVVQGYKGDPDRRIGIVAEVGDAVGWPEMKERVLGEFGGQGEVEGCFGFDAEESWPAEGGGVKLQPNGDAGDACKAVAIMNAFHPEEVDRVIAMAQDQGIVSDCKDCEDCTQLLYLTGAVREPGLVYAREKRMKVICVGHKVCELWGIRYLAQRIREEYPALEVIEVDEEEEPPPSKKRPAVKETTSGFGSGNEADSTKKAKP